MMLQNSRACSVVTYVPNGVCTIHNMMTFRTVRDAFIRAVSLLGLARVYRLYEKQKGPLVRVVAFHDVQNGEAFAHIIKELTIRYNVISPEDFMEGRLDASRINILITFDDGYASWVDVCMPVLEAHHVRALFFINSGLCDAGESTEAASRYVRERLLLSPRHTITWAQVERLASAGHTIGGHGVTHARLSELREGEQRDEIAKDKARIEEMLKTPLTAFAYPFGRVGDYTATTQRILKDAGYTYAFTTGSVFGNLSRPYEISRLCIDDTISTTQLHDWIQGGYDIYHKLKSLCVR